MIKQVYAIGVLSLIIILVSGLFVGMVLGLQGYNTLVDAGAQNSLGVFVVISLPLLASLFMLAMKVGNLSALTGEGGYEIVARFGNIGGLKVRSPVAMTGVRIGRVAESALTTTPTRRLSPFA